MADTTAGEGVPADEMIEQIIYEAFGLGSHSDAAEEATRRIKAHLAAQPAGARGAVAWRWRNKSDGVWNYQEDRQRIPNVEQQPLYATPAQPDTGDVAALRDEICSRFLHAVFLGYEHRVCDDEWEPEYAQEIADKETDRILAALSKPNAPGAR